MRNDIAFGSGPGSYTSVSPITIPLGLQFRRLGPILSPHNFFIGTLGDLGIPGLLCTLFILAYVIVYLPLAHGGRFAMAGAAVGVTTVVQGMGETMDVATGGITWFLLSLFLVSHLRERSALE